MAKDKLEFKNEDEILDAKQKVRGERLKSKDKDILPEPTLEITEFGKPDKIDMSDEFAELHIYDAGGNLLESIYDNLEWTVRKAPGGKTTQGQQVVLKPGNDLRNAGYRVGKFKVVYNFFSELLGTRLDNKVYIEEISATRKEIRILPVRKHPKASLDPNKKPFIKNGTVYDGKTKFDDPINIAEKIVSRMDRKITKVKKNIENYTKRLDHWEEHNKTFNLTGEVELTRQSKRFTPIPFRRGLTKYPNKRYGSLETKKIIDGRIKRYDTYLKRDNLYLARLVDKRKKPQSNLDRLTKWKDKVKLFHSDDKQFFYDFYDFTQGTDTDSYTYSKGVIKSSGTIRDRKITIEDGKFQKCFTGGWIHVKNPNTGEVTYKAKIRMIKGSGSAPRTLIVDRPYMVNGEATMLPATSNFEIKYQNSRVVNRKDLKNLICFDKNRNFVMTNWEMDDVTYTDYPYSVVLRLYEALSEDIKVKDKLWLSRESLAPVIENVNLFNTADEKLGNLLKPPNFDVDDKYIPGASRPTTYETWDDLLSTQTTTKDGIINEIFSGSLDSARLNIKYNNFEDFVNFSSATEQLKNFKYKLTLKELYEDKINELTDVTGSDVITNNVYVEKTDYENKKQKILNDFSGYEKHLYYTTQSYSDQGMFSGSVIDTTWPKLNSTTLYHTTSSVAESWFDDQVASSLLYDKLNTDFLFNNLPLHIGDDDSNVEFHTFIYMIGQHFDTLWQYIKQLTSVVSRTDDVTKGMSKDIVYYVAKSFGVSVEKGTDARRLWREYFGLDISGSAVTGEAAAVGDVITSDDYSKEIWNRLLNNLPMLLKTKGTHRSIKALLACYGIPQTILEIKEYGGPPPDTSKPSYYYKDEFGYGIKMEGHQYISSSWSEFSPTNRFPDGVEIRFDFPYTGMKSDSFLGTTGMLATTSSFTILESSGSNRATGTGAASWAITAENVGGVDDDSGVVKFYLNYDTGETEVVSTTALPIFDGQYNSVLVTRTDSSNNLLTSDATGSDIRYHLYAGKYNVEAHKILYSDHTHIVITGSTNADNVKANESFITPSTLYIGGAPGNEYGHQFIGSFQGYRTWNGEVLSDSTFLDHVAAPTSYTGNYYNSANKYNSVRYSFNQKKNHNLAGYYTESNDRTHLHSSVVDESINTSEDTPGYAVGFPTIASDKYHYEWEVSENRYLVPAIGSKRPTNKIRIEDNELVHGNLNTKKSVEASSQDSAPLDSNRLGVYFSPTNLIDLDIMREFAGIDLADYVGAPLDRYRPNYPDLNVVRRFYFKKYIDSAGKAQGNLIYEYLKLIDYYDRSLFNVIMKFLPARANKSVGILIEPHLLERNKIEWKPIRVEERNYEGGIDIEQYIDVDDYIVNHIEGVIDAEDALWQDTIDPDGSVRGYEGGVDSSTFWNFFGELHTEVGTIDDFVSLISEKHYEEGGIDPDGYWVFSGEKSNLEGAIDPDSYFKFFGEKSNIEGGIDPDSHFNLFGEKSNLEGGTDAETQMILSGRTPNYEGETDAETQMILSGRTPNYEGETDAETEIILSGRTPNFEGETDAETDVNLAGNAITYEGTMVSPDREKYENPLFATLNQLSWSFVSGSDRGSAIRSTLRGGEVFAEFNTDVGSEIRFIGTKYNISGSYDISSHITTHPFGFRELYWESGSMTVNGVEYNVTQSNPFTKITSDDWDNYYQNGVVSNNIVRRYVAAEVTPPYSTVIARQRFDGMKMTSGPVVSIDEVGNQIVGKFGSITPVDWLSLSDSKDTSDGGPVVVVTETSPTTLVVTTTEQQETVYTE